MTWTYTITRQKDSDGNDLPLWLVRQWNTDNENRSWESVITTAVKEVAYPND
jgi:hypothetical protein